MRDIKEDNQVSTDLLLGQRCCHFSPFLHQRRLLCLQRCLQRRQLRLEPLFVRFQAVVGRNMAGDLLVELLDVALEARFRSGGRLGCNGRFALVLVDERLDLRAATA